MPTMAEAAQLKALTDQPGTGNITELCTGPPYSGTHYAAHQIGSTVTIAEAELLDEAPNPGAANHAATQALAYPASH